MKFSLLVCSAPEPRQGSSALKFAQTLLTQHHLLYRVFFYGDGVYHASPTAGATAELNSADLWRTLAVEHGVDLVVCSTAASERGLIDEITLQSVTAGSAPLPGFELAGLGQLADAAAHSERIITFG